MKLLRFIVVLAVIGYAGWLAWPFISPFLEGAGPDVAASRMGAEAQSGGELFGFLPAWTLWVGAVALYLIAALLLGTAIRIGTVMKPSWHSKPTSPWPEKVLAPKTR
jgi:hypothetical protein